MTELLHSNPHSDQLKEACKLAQALWAAWIQYTDGVWTFRCQSGMAKIRLDRLHTLLQEKSTTEWLVGALSSRRVRWRETGPHSNLANCLYLMVFPNAQAHQLLLVGANSIDKHKAAFWRVLALQSPDLAFQPKPVMSLPPLQVSQSPDAVTRPIDSSLPSPEALRQLKALRETALDLAQMDHETAPHQAQNTPPGVTEPILALLQRFLHRVRTLLEARGAQVALLEKLTPAERTLPEAARKHLFSLRTILSDYDADTPYTSSAWSGDLSLAHNYIAATGESLLLTDFPAWAGISSGLQPVEVIAPPSTEADSNTAYPPCRSLIGVPLRFQMEILGTLVIADDRPAKTFNQTNQSLLELLTPQIAIAIRGAQLIQELQERIAAQHLAESRLVRSVRLAAVGEMATGVAHELNNPLTTVIGFVELVLNELPPTSPLHDDLDLALKEALRARSVVRGLLDFSRPSQDQRRPTDLNDLISQVLTIIRHLLRMNNLTLRLELWDDLPMVSVDPNQIQQVLHNLMRNAIQAMPSGGTLTVGTALTQKPDSGLAPDENRWVSIVVQDTGIGIPPENLERIFEPFFTHHTSSRPEDIGIGLGLSVSYGIIKSHGGSIEVDSTVNQGSRFTVYLPLEANPQT